MSKTRSSWSFLNASVKSSFLWSLVLTLLPVVSSFVVSMFIARWGGERVWGTVSWTMAFATAILIVGKLGLGLGASRLASEYGVDRAGNLRRLFRTGFELRAAITLVMAIVAVVAAETIAHWFHDADLVWPIRIGSLIVICASFYEYQEHFLVGLNRHAMVSRVRAAMLTTRVLLTVGLLLAGAGAVRVLGGYVVAWGLGIAAFSILLHKFLPRGEDTESKGAIRSRLLAISIPLAISSASVTVYSQMDKLMLGYFHSVEEVGFYSIARAVAEVSLFPTFAMVMTLRPALASRFGAGQLDQCAKLIRESLKLSLVFGVLFASVLAIHSVSLFSFVYSPQFEYSGELMRWFVVVIILRSMGAMMLPALIAAERTRTYAVLTTISALMNFGLNLILVPRMHAAGAIIATVISYSFLLSFGLGRVFGIFGVRPSWKAVFVAIRTVLAGILAAGIMWTLMWRSSVEAGAAMGWTVLLWSAGHAAVYIIMVFGLRVVSPKDLLSIVPRKSHP